MFESNVILSFLEDKYGDAGPRLTPRTPEGRAAMELLCRVHDLYIASPNTTAPGFSHSQGAMYLSYGWHGPERGMDLPTRAAKIAEIWRRLCRSRDGAQAQSCVTASAVNRQLCWLEAELEASDRRRAMVSRLHLDKFTRDPDAADGPHLLGQARRVLCTRVCTPTRREPSTSPSPLPPSPSAHSRRPDLVPHLCLHGGARRSLAPPSFRQPGSPPPRRRKLSALPCLTAAPVHAASLLRLAAAVRPRRRRPGADAFPAPRGVVLCDAGRARRRGGPRRDLGLLGGDGGGGPVQAHRGRDRGQRGPHAQAHLRGATRSTLRPDALRPIDAPRTRARTHPPPALSDSQVPQAVQLNYQQPPPAGKGTGRYINQPDLGDVVDEHVAAEVARREGGREGGGWVAGAEAGAERGGGRGRRERGVERER